MKILLKEIQLYGYHGIHELERKVGVLFQLDVSIEFSDNRVIKNIEDTIDYSRVFSIIKREFSLTEQLLEILAERIASSLKVSFPYISNTSLRIIKKGAYIDGLIGSVGVELNKDYNID